MEGNFLEAISSFGEVHEAFGEERSLYLLFWLNEDLKRLRNQVNEFTQKQEDYLETDFIGLMFDADRKARETRSKSRIRRIAQILTASVQMEPIPSPDDTEEMVRIATQLSDEEVLVLHALRDQQTRYEKDGGRTMTGLTLAAVEGLGQEKVLGICGKLLSLGLIAEPEQRAVALGLGSYPRGGGYIVLSRGVGFLEFIATQET
jgi:hypothetical protein